MVILPGAAPHPRSLAVNVRKGDAPERGKGEVEKRAPSDDGHLRSHKREETLALRQKSRLTFYHPDFTVGPGVSPDRGVCRSGALAPTERVAVRWAQRRGPPLAGYTADRELERFAIAFPHPAPKVYVYRFPV